MDGELSVVVEDRIAIIEFHHPKGNSLPGKLLKQLSDAITNAGSDDSVYVVHLRSRGSTFCAGASFDELLAIENEDEAQLFFSGFGTLIEAIKNCPKFVIAEVQGKAVGGGVGIIAACDYAIAADSACIKLSELSIGFGPFVIASAVIRKIGLSAFSTLTIDSKNWRSAGWAAEKGLFNEIVAETSELRLKTTELCKSLSGYSPVAMMHIKAMLWENYDDLEQIHNQKAKLSGALSQTELTQSILANFKR